MHIFNKLLANKKVTMPARISWNSASSICLYRSGEKQLSLQRVISDSIPFAEDAYAINLSSYCRDAAFLPEQDAIVSCIQVIINLFKPCISCKKGGFRDPIFGKELLRDIFIRG